LAAGALSGSKSNFDETKPIVEFGVWFQILVMWKNRAMTAWPQRYDAGRSGLCWHISWDSFQKQKPRSLARFWKFMTVDLDRF